MVSSSAFCQTPNCNGSNFAWSQTAGSTGIDNGQRTVTDANGNVYVTGDFNGTATFGAQSVTAPNGGGGDIFLAKYDAAGTLLWVRAAGGTQLESSRGLAVDAAGNCYVSGSFRSASLQFGATAALVASTVGTPDAFVVKYDPSGTALWARQGGGGNSDAAYAVGVDASGNVYITGIITSSTSPAVSFSGTGVAVQGGEDMFLAKYNSAGTFQWVQRAGGTEGGIGGTNDEMGTDLTVDGSGNCFVSGYFNTSAPVFAPQPALANSSGTTGVYDAFIAKYNTSGSAIWAKKAGGTLADGAAGVDIDATGNVYLTGYFAGTAGFGSAGSLSSAGANDAFLAKYTSTGTEVWARRWGGTGSEVAANIASDAAGNTYVSTNFAGSLTFGSLTALTSAGGNDVYVVLYDNTGNAVWQRQLGGALEEIGNNVAVSTAGHIYITGSFTGATTVGVTLPGSAGSTDIFLIRVCSAAPVATAATTITTTDFTVNWTAAPMAISYQLDISTNSSFSSFVTGYTNLSVNATSKLVTGLAAGTTYYYRVRAVNASGSSASSNVITVNTLVITCSGDFIWGQTVGAGGGDAGYAVDTDDAGNSYVTGSFSGTLTVAGQSFTSAGGLDMLLVKYNATGVAQWARKAGGSGDDAGRGIYVDGAGNSYLTGWYQNTATFDATRSITSVNSSYDVFVAKYDANGTLQWVRSAGGTGEDRGVGIGLDGAGNPYVTGWFAGTAAFGSTLSTPASVGSSDMFIARYNTSTGAEEWVRTAGSTGPEQGVDIAVDAAGNSYVTGYFSATVSFTHPTTPLTLTSSGDLDLYVARYAPDGTVQWAKRAGGTGPDYGASIAIDASGNPYVTGYISASATFDILSPLISDGGTDIFVAKFNAADGVAQWAKRAGGTSNELAYDIALDASANLYITGYFNGQVSFGSLPVMASAGGRDIFVAKYNTSGLEQWAKSAGNTGDDRGIGITVDASGTPFVTGDFFNTISLGTSLTSIGGNDLFLTKVCNSAPSCSAPVNLANGLLTLTAPLDFATVAQLDATALLKWSVNSVPERTATQYSVLVQVVPESVDANGSLAADWNSVDKKQIQLNYGTLSVGTAQQLLSDLLSAPNQDTRYFWRVGLQYLAAANGIQPIEWTDAQSFTLNGLTQAIPAAYLAGSHTNNINWVYEVTYLDEGKTSQGIAYVDGLGKTRQTQSLVNSNVAGSKVLATEVAYSEEGGGAVQSMAAPTGLDQFNYATRFFDVKTGTMYSDFTTAHFDREVKGATSNTLLSPEPVDNATGVGKYYSANSPEAYVDDAGGFPYAYSVSYKDPLSRPMLSGSVGPTLKVTGGKEIQYFSVKASQEELSRVYGTSATSRMEGIVKNVTIDPNGVGSVSYLDQEGQLIATALTGCSTTTLNLDALNEDGQAGFTQRYNGLQNDALNPDTYEKSSQTNFFVSCATTVTLAYQLDLATFYTTATTCRNCEYDLEIRLVEDATGLEVYKKTDKLPTTTSTSADCNAPVTTYSLNQGVALTKAGSYTVYRRLVPKRNAATGQTLLEETLASADAALQADMVNQKETFANEYFSRDEWYVLRKTKSNTTRVPEIKRCSSVFIGKQGNNVFVNGTAQNATIYQLGLDLEVGRGDTLYFTDKDDADNTYIRKVSPSGNVVTYYTTNEVIGISDMTTDELGNVYYTSGYSTIYKVTSGIRTTFYTGKAGISAIKYHKGKIYFLHNSDVDGGTKKNLSVLTNTGTLSRNNYLVAGSELLIADGVNSMHSLVVRSGVNGSEEIYLSAIVNGTAPNDGARVIKVASNGTYSFVGAKGSLVVNPINITTDQTGNLYINEETAIVKVSPAGEFSTLLTTPYGYSGFYGMAVDQAGNFFYGEVNYGTGINYIKKYAPCGFETACSEILSKASIKFSSPLNEQTCASGFNWVNQAGGTGNDYGQAIKVDAAGNSYVTGYFTGTVTFGTTIFTSNGSNDLFVAKYDVNGTILWVRQVGGTGNDYGRSISVDAAGNSYVTGSFSGTATFGTTSLTSNGSNEDLFVAKYDVNGMVVWVKQAGAVGSDYGRGISLDAAGNSYVTGSFSGTVIFGTTSLTSNGTTDLFVAKYDVNGAVVWVKQAGGTSDSDYGYGIAVDAAGNSYVTGSCLGTATFGTTTISLNNSGYFTAKYDANGVVLWVKNSSGSATGNLLKKISVDAAGNSYVTGHFSGTVTFGTTTLTSTGQGSIYVVKYAPDGTNLWAKQAGGNTLNSAGQDIVVDAAGNSYVTGYFTGTATFGTLTLTSNGSNDIFVAKYDVNGTVIWVKQAGAASSDNSFGIAVDAAGYSYITGYFNNTVPFGCSSVTSNGGFDIFVAKVSPGSATGSPTCTSLNSYTTYATATVSVVPGADNTGSAITIGQAAWNKGMSQEAFVSALVTSINSNYNTNDAGFIASNDKGTAYPGSKNNTLKLSAKTGSGKTYNGWKVSVTVTYTSGIDNACFTINQLDNLPFSGGFDAGQCEETRWYADQIGVLDLTTSTPKQLLNLDGRQVSDPTFTESYSVTGIGTAVAADANTKTRFLDTYERMNWTRPKDTDILSMETYAISGSSLPTLPVILDSKELVPADQQSYQLLRVRYKTPRCEDQCVPRTFPVDCSNACEEKALSLDVEVQQAYVNLSTNILLYPTTPLPLTSTTKPVGTHTLKQLVDLYYPLSPALLTDITTIDEDYAAGNTLPKQPSAANLYLAYEAARFGRASYDGIACQQTCNGDKNAEQVCTTANGDYNSCVMENYAQLTKGYEYFIEKWDNDAVNNPSQAYPYTSLTQLQTEVKDGNNASFTPAKFAPNSDEREKLGPILYNYLVANFRATADLTRANWDTQGGTCTNCGAPGNATYGCAPTKAFDVSMLASKLIPLLQQANAVCTSNYTVFFEKSTNYEGFACQQNLSECLTNLPPVSATYTQAQRDADAAICSSRYDCNRAPYALRVRSGNTTTAYVATDGRSYGVDQGFSTSSVYTAPTAYNVRNTTEDALYQSVRYATGTSPLNYSLTVPNGTYQLLLHFSENYFGATGGAPTQGQAGKRVFHINLEGEQRLSNYDILADVGPMAAAVKDFRVTITDGVLNIDLLRVVGDPLISGIELISTPVDAAQRQSLIQETVATVYSNPTAIQSQTSLLYTQTLTTKLTDLPALLMDYATTEKCRMECQGYFQQAFEQWIESKKEAAHQLIISSFTSRCLPVGALATVDWINPVGTTVSGTTLTKTAVTNDWLAGANSSQTIGNGGYVESIITETTTSRMMGLSTRNNTSPNYSTIQYAIYMRSDAQLEVYEGLTKKYPASGQPVKLYKTGDKIRVAIVNGVIKYYHNGTELIASPASATPSLPLRVDVAMISPGATLKDVNVFDNRNEQLTVSYSQSLYHYTLYEYNRNGQMVSTVPPEGIDYIDIANVDPVKANRAPEHRMRTSYQTNSVGELAQSASPDGGTSLYLYDKAGRVRFSQNAEQRTRTAGSLIFSYTKYEAETGRILEMGEYVAVADASGKDFSRPSGNVTTDVFASDQVDVLSWPTDGSRTFQESYFYYDNVYLAGQQQNLSQRVSKVSNASVNTYYSYDKHGRVSRVTQELLDMDAALGGQRLKTVEYRYQPLTSQVKEVIYQPINSATPASLGSGVNVSITDGQNGSNLRKTGGANNSWDAGAATARLVGNNSYVQTTVGETNTSRIIGLSETNADVSFNAIQYGFYLRDDGILQVYESGFGKGSSVSYSTGDQLRIAVENNQVKYYRNSTLLYSSAVPVATVQTQLPLLVDASLYTNASATRQATLLNVHTNVLLSVPSAVTWGSGVNLSVSGNSLTKTGGTNGVWDAGAATGLIVGNGSYVETTVAETNTYRIIGLSNTNPDANYTSIKYALDMLNNGTLAVYENGSAIPGNFGTYQMGDKLRILVENNQVKYLRNNDLLYTSLQVPTLPLLVDVSLHTTGATLKNVIVSSNSHATLPADHFRHRYSYDSDNRLIKAEVSRDSTSWAKISTQTYYTHGAVKALGLGDEIQRLDYVYNLQGWLKAINHPLQASDPGQDGLGTGSPYAKDVFGMVLHYYNGDYTRSGKGLDATAALTPQANSQLKAQGKDLFNGNISGWVTYTGFEQTAMSTPRASLLGQGFRYDLLNRLVGSFAEEKATTGFTGWTATGTTLPNVYQEKMTYDANGNIQTLVRTAFDRGGTLGVKMDNLTYRYANTIQDPNDAARKRKAGNRLKFVDDTDGTDGTITEDFRDQNGDALLGDNAASDNFAYDAKGRLIRDTQSEIQLITWTANDKVASVTRTAGSTKANLYFTYDALARRVSKKVVKPNVDPVTSFYIYDGSGNAMAIYTKNQTATSFTYTITEQHLYGAKRVGSYDNGNVLFNSAGTTTVTTTMNKALLQFELTDHLGNVRAVVTGVKVSTNQASVAMLADYYPFGMEMPGRKFTTSTSRYGFNGMEKDDEFSGSGNEYNFDARSYDSRLGRWLSVDPHASNYAPISPFTFAINNPILFVDTDGRDVFIYSANFRLLARIITNNSNHVYYIIDQITISKEIPNIPGVFPIVKSQIALSASVDAFGIGASAAAYMGTGKNVGAEIVVFTKGPEAFQPIGFTYSGGGVGDISGGYGVELGFGAYVFGAQKWDSRDESKMIGESWRGLFASYNGSFGFGGGVFWGNADGIPDAFPGHKATATWVGVKVNIPTKAATSIPISASLQFSNYVQIKDSYPSYNKRQFLALKNCNCYNGNVKRGTTEWGAPMTVPEAEEAIRKEQASKSK